MDKETRALEEKLSMLEKEIATLAERLDGEGALRGELEDLKLELRALKVFLERHHPEMGRELPSIIGKLKTG